MIFLENNFLKVAITSKGAELKSVIGKKNNYEFLWQADENVWARSAPVLFPVVGKCYNNELLINGKIYEMPQHGFARDMNFEVIKKSKSQITFRLLSNNETFLIFPFQFDLRLTYMLRKSKITCKYEVKNTGTETMYFSIGAHPAFNLPTKKLTDYYIGFDEFETAERFLLSDGLLNNEKELLIPNELLLEPDKILFEKDAIVFKNLQSKRISILPKKTNIPDLKIEIEFDDFPYFGIWSKKNCEEFICLEPWCGIAGSIGKQIPIEQKEGINKLPPDKNFERKYSIKFHYEKIYIEKEY